MLDLGQGNEPGRQLDGARSLSGGRRPGRAVHVGLGGLASEGACGQGPVVGGGRESGGAHAEAEPDATVKAGHKEAVSDTLILLGMR
jgi:hypothetical protein